MNSKLETGLDTIEKFNQEEEVDVFAQSILFVAL